MKNKIYVINRASHDYSGASRYGEIVYLSDGPINLYATNKIYRQMHEKLKNSTPDDYILLTGLTVMSSIACAIFATKHHKLNLLIFKPETHTYVERRLVIREEE
jgi:hypothetical protein